MKDRPTSGMGTRQKITAGVLSVIVIFILYEIYGLFKKETPTVVTTTTTEGIPVLAKTPTPPQQANLIPKQQQPVMSQREAQLMQLQQETEAKYLAAINELQMLRIERDIAETNKAIMVAKLDTITAQKGIVDLLKPAPTMPVNYTRVVGGTTTTTETSPAVPVVQGEEVRYTVISVSQLQYRWGAVMGYQGNLYNVSIGDILPPDGSRVISIGKSGVVLQKNGVTKKVSLVPII